MRRALWAAALAALLLGCAPPPPQEAPAAPPTAVEESAIETRIAVAVAATLTAMPTATPLPPAEVAGEPTVAPPMLEDMPGTRFVVDSEYELPPHLVRWWRAADEAAPPWARVVTIHTPGQPPLQIDHVSAIDALSGTDVTGSGVPNLVLHSFSGGAHCCFATTILEMGEVPHVVLQTPPSNCGGYLDDVTGDGAFEFITCDDLFAYAYCPHASSPMVMVVLAYDEEHGYLPAGPRLAHLYEDEIARNTILAEESAPGDLGEFDDSNRCAVLPLVLDYLYSGRPELAWEALERHYSGSDPEAWRAEIEERLAESPYYRP